MPRQQSAEARSDPTYSFVGTDGQSPSFDISKLRGTYQIPNRLFISEIVILPPNDNVVGPINTAILWQPTIRTAALDASR